MEEEEKWKKIRKRNSERKIVKVKRRCRRGMREKEERKNRKK